MILVLLLPLCVETNFQFAHYPHEWSLVELRMKRNHASWHLHLENKSCRTLNYRKFHHANGVQTFVTIR